jgi:UTP-glucose-1-phosphate uridylyltransferase
VQFIARDGQCQQLLRDYLADVLGLDSYCLTVPKTKAVRKAVIPLAGYGTRMYPATKILRKEFFPIVDADGLVKPALLIMLDELLSAGIEEVCLIIRPEDEEQYLSLFSSLRGEVYEKLKGNLRAYERKLAAIWDRITFAYQDKMLGFGHAVLQSEKFAGGEPVLLMLGDLLFGSNTDSRCAAQLISAYEQTEQLTIGLFEVDEGRAPSYGCVKGAACSLGNPRLVKLESIVEKPRPEVIKAHLGVDGRQYAILMYLLTPDVYRALEKQCRAGKTEFDEYQLTPALAEVMRAKGAYGYIIDGKQYDVGMPSEYRATVAAFGRE